jgi:hypothetical protein
MRQVFLHAWLGREKSWPENTDRKSRYQQETREDAGFPIFGIKVVLRFLSYAICL